MAEVRFYKHRMGFYGFRNEKALRQETRDIAERRLIERLDKDGLILLEEPWIHEETYEAYDGDGFCEVTVAGEAERDRQG